MPADTGHDLAIGGVALHSFTVKTNASTWTQSVQPDVHPSFGFVVRSKRGTRDHATAQQVIMLVPWLLSGYRGAKILSRFCLLNKVLNRDAVG